MADISIEAGTLVISSGESPSVASKSRYRY